jgi:Cysteine rich repeat
MREVSPMNLRILPLIATIAICSAVPVEAQDNGMRGALRDACQEDYRRLCADVAPGGGRVKKCMADNSAKLSATCKTALGTAGKSH